MAGIILPQRAVTDCVDGKPIAPAHTSHSAITARDPKPASYPRRSTTSQRHLPARTAEPDHPRPGGARPVAMVHVTRSLARLPPPPRLHDLTKSKGWKYIGCGIDNCWIPHAQRCADEREQHDPLRPASIPGKAREPSTQVLRTAVRCYLREQHRGGPRPQAGCCGNCLMKLQGEYEGAVVRRAISLYPAWSRW